MRSAVVISLWALLMLCSSTHAANLVTFNAAGDTVINGTATFPISINLPPPPDGKTPTGKAAYDELREGGVTCFRVPPPRRWNAAGDAMIHEYLDAAGKHGLYAWISLHGINKFDTAGTKAEATLRRVIAEFKGDPALIAWKGKDEPAWGGNVGPVPPSAVIRVYKVIKEVDNYNHPVNVFQAPRRTWQQWVPYMPGCDFTGVDIFPVSYPPGSHSNLPNTGLSVVGDETQRITWAAGGRPVWMTLQIAWSGVAKTHGRTLRYPTFFEERYMTYQAIIDGSRGFDYFGGNITQDLTDRDKKLGWNWRFWDRVLKPVLAEINADSPLHAALLAPNSTLPIAVEMADLPAGADGGNGIEFCVREVGKDLYIIAAKREGSTFNVKFTGLPLDIGEGEVMYEPPRTVEAKDGSFTDWFGPNDVHVYCFHRSNPSKEQLNK
ncbi:MAG TPA: hypothetical protein VG722_01520 [Tepidisphaeraceae bacterium]|nr:hypothetical protein [Tepidisphaeraceae bacterium]